ncbi:MAG: rRNA pseudouridine synthase [Clostridiales bacterium]|jgi:16S rRNA pseudouridine516 synthase|nr:rRNA pseudouridine synthase [Clostridiales bacterium]
MRLDKLIANCGFGSRKEAKALCKKGLVTVDGVVVRRSEAHIDPECNRVCVGEHVIEYEKYSYLMMNKPAGVISATFDEEHQTVVDLLEERYIYANVFPVGRLDLDTTGLLILSNDGGFAHRALSPKKKVAKIYHARVDKPITDSEIKAFGEGVTLDDGYKCLPAKLEAPEDFDDFAKVEIYEGKYHQVKRMFAALGIRVISLKRVEFAGLTLDEGLAPGDYRRLNEDELKIISNLLSKD